MLADDPGVRTLGLGGTPHGACHVVVDVDRAEPAGHVGDVDAPAVQADGRAHPPGHDRVGALHHRGAHVGAGVVELGQRVVAHPGLVVAVGAEAVPAAGGRLGVGDRLLEPLVGVAGVVGGQVAEQPHPAVVEGVGEAGVGAVAAEQVVDPVEGGGVVAVVALAGEDRRRVEHRRPGGLHVVEVLGHPVEVAPEELERGPRVAALEDDLVVPGGRDRPGGRGAVVGRGAAGEAVGEDLVDHGLPAPGGSRRVRADAVVEGVRAVVVDQPRGGQPLLAAVDEDEQEAVVRHRAVHEQVGVPPRRVPVVGRPGLVEDRLGVVRRAQPDLRDLVAAGPHPDADRAVQRRGLGVEVERGAVVVGLVEEAHGDMLPDPAPPGTGGSGCRETRTCSRFRA